MIISRKAYKRAIKDAVFQAEAKMREEQWHRNFEDEMYRKTADLEERIVKLEYANGLRKGSDEVMNERLK